MKVQYFGDVNDYRKFALLRLLAREGRFKIGVVWMLTPDDDRAEGNRRAYAKQPDKWRSFDLPGTHARFTRGRISVVRPPIRVASEAGRP